MELVDRVVFWNIHGQLSWNQVSGLPCAGHLQLGGDCSLALKLEFCSCSKVHLCLQANPPTRLMLTGGLNSIQYFGWFREQHSPGIFLQRHFPHSPQELQCLHWMARLAQHWVNGGLCKPHLQLFCWALSLLCTHKTLRRSWAFLQSK